MPLQLDQHEAVTWKQRRRLHTSLTRQRDAFNAQSGQIDLEPAQAETMQRQTLAVGLKLSAGPVTLDGTGVLGSQ